MSIQDHILVRDSAEPETVAGWLAPLLGMELSRGDRGKVMLYRPARSGGGDIGGRVYANDVADPNAGPEAEALIDGFPIVFDMNYTGRDRAVQFDEARQVYTELIGSAAVASAFVRGYDLLIAASTAGGDVVWFPAGTTPYPEHRHLWQGFLPQPLP